jgi:hypothetical protein
MGVRARERALSLAVGQSVACPATHPRVTIHYTPTYASWLKAHNTPYRRSVWTDRNVTHRIRANAATVTAY